MRLRTSSKLGACRRSSPTWRSSHGWSGSTRPVLGSNPAVSRASAEPGRPLDRIEPFVLSEKHIHFSDALTPPPEGCLKAGAFCPPADRAGFLQQALPVRNGEHRSALLFENRDTFWSLPALGNGTRKPASGVSPGAKSREVQRITERCCMSDRTPNRQGQDQIHSGASGFAGSLCIPRLKAGAFRAFR